MAICRAGVYYLKPEKKQKITKKIDNFIACDCYASQAKRGPDNILNLKTLVNAIPESLPSIIDQKL